MVDVLTYISKTKTRGGSDTNTRLQTRLQTKTSYYGASTYLLSIYYNLKAITKMHVWKCDSTEFK